MRAHGIDCQRVGDPNASGCAGGVNTAQFANLDNGDLNYRKGQLFAAYVKGTHELLLNFPEDIKFMARGTWLYDVAASHTDRSDLNRDAFNQVARDGRLLDLWVSKGFSIGDQSARVRLGNQVINWGESIFGLGGINSTNALDIQKVLVPGTQIKEAVLPAPMLSFATGLGHGFNMEAYYQFQWNGSRLPPVGSYFSVADNVGRGGESYNISTENPNFSGTDATTIARSHDQAAIQRAQAGINQGAFAGPPFNTFGVPLAGNQLARNAGQYGMAFHFKPEGTQLDLGAYVMNYHDKLPSLTLRADDTIQTRFLEDRKLYGVSANFPVGDWAVGWELSYRPHDAVALSACYGPNGPLDFITNGVTGVDCQQWIDKTLPDAPDRPAGTDAQQLRRAADAARCRYRRVYRGARRHLLPGREFQFALRPQRQRRPGDAGTRVRAPAVDGHLDQQLAWLSDLRREGYVAVDGRHGRLQLDVRRPADSGLAGDAGGHLLLLVHGLHADRAGQLHAGRQVGQPVRAVQPEPVEVAGRHQLHALLGRQPAGAATG